MICSSIKKLKTVSHIYLLGGLKEDHLLHGFHGKHSQRTLLTTAGKMGATLTERHTTHLQMSNNSNT